MALRSKLYLGAAALILLGLFQPSLLSQLLPARTAPTTNPALAVTALIAPIAPLILVLIADLSAWRLSARASLALRAAAMGLGLISIFLGLFLGPGAAIFALQGVALVLAICSAILLLTEGRRTRVQNLAAAAMMALAAGVAIWSLAAIPAIYFQANAIANGRPFCIAFHGGRPVASFAEMRGASFFTTATGYKDTSRWYFHGVMLVGERADLKAFNWSPRRFKFDEIENFRNLVAPIDRSCVPQTGFWGTLRII